jgi:hypothetical protein
MREQAGEKRTFLVAVSGCGSDDDRRRSNLAGIDLHLLKPVAPAVLVGILERFQRVIAPPGEVPVGTGPDRGSSFDTDPERAILRDDTH